MSCRLCHVSTASVSEQPLHHHPGSVAGVPDSYAPPACNVNLPSAFRKIITCWIKRSPEGRRTILVATFSIYAYFGNFCVLCLWKSIHHLPPLSAACPGVSLLAVGLYTAFCPYGTLLFSLVTHGLFRDGHVFQRPIWFIFRSQFSRQKTHRNFCTACK